MNSKFTSSYTGQTIESAIAKALQLDTFVYNSDETIDDITFHILWKTEPTATNTVYGIAIHPTGKMYNIVSTNGTRTVYSYISENDLNINPISEATINAIFNGTYSET